MRVKKSGISPPLINLGVVGACEFGAESYVIKKAMVSNDQWLRFLKVQCMYPKEKNGEMTEGYLLARQKS